MNFTKLMIGAFFVGLTVTNTITVSLLELHYVDIDFFIIDFLKYINSWYDYIGQYIINWTNGLFSYFLDWRLSKFYYNILVLWGLPGLLILEAYGEFIDWETILSAVDDLPFFLSFPLILIGSILFGVIITLIAPLVYLIGLFVPPFNMFLLPILFGQIVSLCTLFIITDLYSKLF